MSDWPKWSDGRNKKMAEMTREEQREQWKAAGARVTREFEDKARIASIAAWLNEPKNTRRQ